MPFRSCLIPARSISRLRPFHSKWRDGSHSPGIDARWRRGCCENSWVFRTAAGRHDLGRTRTRRAASTDAPPATPLMWVIREGLKFTGTKFGCGTGSVRRLHGAYRRQARVFVPNSGLGDRRQVRDHDRRTVGGFVAPAAEGLARRAGAAMWLLPVWTNHERGRLAPAESQADTRADRRAYERESLPLRNLSTHRARG